MRRAAEERLIACDQALHGVDDRLDAGRAGEIAVDGEPKLPPSRERIAENLDEAGLTSPAERGQADNAKASARSPKLGDHAVTGEDKPRVRHQLLEPAY